MTIHTKRNALMTFAFILSGTSSFGCGADTDCPVGDRSYRIALPQTATPDAPLGALVFAHGFGGSAQGTMNNTNLRRLADELGIALIALQVDSPDWELPFSPRAYDADGSREFLYVDQVLQDVTARHSVDPGSVMMSGFSAGGMLTWNLACKRSDSFRAFVPMSGTFWLNVPNDCDQPASSVYHFHGDSDGVVPLEGRQIRNTHQGSVTGTLAMYSKLGGFGDHQSLTFGSATCDLKKNTDGIELAFCSFAGGHSFEVDFLRATWARTMRQN